MGRTSRDATPGARRRCPPAIRKHGANVGMDDIAAQAGVSKTVLYRHFGDRAGLYAAVVESVHSYIHEGLTNALKLTDAADIGRLATDIADAYLGLVERDPEIYRFVLVRPAAGPAGVIDPAGASARRDRRARGTGHRRTPRRPWHRLRHRVDMGSWPGRIRARRRRPLDGDRTRDPSRRGGGTHHPTLHARVRWARYPSIKPASSQTRRNNNDVDRRHHRSWNVRSD